MRKDKRIKDRNFNDIRRTTEGGDGVLVDHRDAVATDVPCFSRRGFEQVDGAEADCAGGLSSRPMTTLTLSPEPDSPRMPTLSPQPTAYVTPLTALTSPCGVWNATCRSATVRTASPGGGPVSAEHK